jgi:hypothetical protein
MNDWFMCRDDDHEYDKYKSLTPEQQDVLNRAIIQAEKMALPCSLRCGRM